MANQSTLPIHLAAIELDHSQPQKGTPIYTNKFTTKGTRTASMHQKLPKAFDMRFYCMRNHIRKVNFNLILCKGKPSMDD